MIKLAEQKNIIILYDAEHKTKTKQYSIWSCTHKYTISPAKL